MKKMFLVSLFSLAAWALAQSSAAAGGCGKGGCGSGGCGFSPCIDVYHPCISIPQLRIPVFLPHVRIYCERNPQNYCNSGQPWYTSFPQQQMSTGYNYAPYGSFQGGGGWGAPANQPVSGQGSYFQGGSMGMSAPHYWYGR